LAQKSYDTHESSERAALKELLSTLELVGTLIKADALHITQAFCWCLAKGAVVLLTFKGNQKTPHHQIQCQFQGKRHIPFTPKAQGKKHGRYTIWEMRGLAEGFREAVGSSGTHQGELARR
jgi:hypothetical protein